MSEQTTVVVEDDEFDLDAVAAEAVAAPMKFRWQGQHWTLKHASKIDLRLLVKADSGDILATHEALMAAMGPEQAALFENVPQDADAMVKLFNTWTARAGTKSGESAASSISSEPTEKPSRPASQRTTRASSSRTSGKARSPRAS